MKRLTIALAFAAACGCSDPVDKAAKARIFSPEDPPKVLASASEKMPADKLAEDAALARRVLAIGTAEATERIGAHDYLAKLSFDWTAGQHRQALTETRQLTAAAGGVSGDFHAVIENDRDQGMEVLRVRGEVFARSRYGKFRQRLRDRGMAERAREEITSPLRDVNALFNGRLALKPDGTGTHEGRTVYKYDVALAPEAQAQTTAADVPLPELIAPKDGVDPSTQLRQAFFANREPKSLSGEVWVDEATQVVVKAKLNGRLAVAATESSPAAELKLTLDSTISDIGKDPSLKPPKEFLPDADKPTGIADALDRFGIPRTGRQDDTAKAPPAEDPDDATE